MDVEEAYEEMLRQERQQVAQLKTTTPGGTAGNHPLTSAADSSSVVEFSPRQLPDGTPSKSAGAASPTRSSTRLSPQNTPYTTTAGSQVRIITTKYQTVSMKYSVHNFPSVIIKTNFLMCDIDTV